MRATTHEKAVRQFLSAFLSGVFSTREINEIAQSLMSRDGFGVELGATLRAVSEQLTDITRTRRFRNVSDNASADSVVHHTLQLVGDAGVTQRELIGMFEHIWPEFGDAMRNKRWPTARLLQEFFDHARPDRRSKFLKELTNRARIVSGKSDSYLDLISDRLRE